MSIISQIGVVILIAFIVLVLIRSNKNLKKASEEGENFVDEWALRQEKKEEIRQKREEKKLEVQKEKEQKKIQKKQKRKGLPVCEKEEEQVSEEKFQDSYDQKDEETYPEWNQDHQEYEEAYSDWNQNDQEYEEVYPGRNQNNQEYGKVYPGRNQNNQEYGKVYPGRNQDDQEYESRSSWDDQPGYEGESLRVNADWLYDYEEKEKQRQKQTRPENSFTENTKQQTISQQSGKIVPMKKRQTTGITLMKLDANHRVMARYRVNQIPFTIGRSTNNDLVLDDLCVARNHCRIIEKDGRYILEDVGTMNKLYVNGMMTSQVPLSEGIRVYIGNEEFQIEVEGGRSQSTRLYRNAEGSYE